VARSLAESDDMGVDVSCEHHCVVPRRRLIASGGLWKTDDDLAAILDSVEVVINGKQFADLFDRLKQIEKRQDDTERLVVRVAESVSNQYPSYFVLVPAIKPKLWIAKMVSNAINLVLDQFSLLPLCEFACEGRPWYHPPSEAQPQDITDLKYKELIRKITPALKYTAMLLKVIESAVTFSGVPLPKISMLLSCIVDMATSSNMLGDINTAASTLTTLDLTLSNDVINRSTLKPVRLDLSPRRKAIAAAPASPAASPKVAAPIPSSPLATAPPATVTPFDDDAPVAEEGGDAAEEGQNEEGVEDDARSIQSVASSVMPNGEPKKKRFRPVKNGKKLFGKLTGTYKSKDKAPELGSGASDGSSSSSSTSSSSAAASSSSATVSRSASSATTASTVSRATSGGLVGSKSASQTPSAAVAVVAAQPSPSKEVEKKKAKEEVEETVSKYDEISPVSLMGDTLVGVMALFPEVVRVK